MRRFTARHAFALLLLGSAAVALAQDPLSKPSADERAAKLAGQEPLPGERTGIASGRSRLNDAYWARQEKLQKAVDRAQRRLDRAEKALRDADS